MGNFSRGFKLTLLIVIISGCLSAELQIFPAIPVITRSVGTMVLVTCRGFGNPSLYSSLQWLDPNNRTITNVDPHRKDRTSIEMMTDNTLALIFSSLQESEAGAYTCTGVYSNTQPVSKTVQIQTIIAITWLDAPLEQYPIIGSDYKVRCRVTAQPAPIVDWIRNGNASFFLKNDRYIVDTDGLLIKNIKESDDGIYTCRAMVLETGDLNERNIKLEVQTPPSIDESMVSELEVVDGESASIECKARGKPPPTYTWIHTSTNKNLETAERFSVNKNTGVLTITRVSREDNGVIQCMATNPAGAVEKDVKLVVIIKPQVLDIRNISISTGKEARLECRATGNPLPTVSFWKIGASSKFVTGPQPEDNNVVVENRKDLEKGQAITTLIISPLRKSDDGLYTCTASNKGGESKKNGHLIVEFPPSFANTPMKEAWTWSHKPVNISCIAESIPNATITWKLNNQDIERNPNFRKEGNGPFSSILVVPTDQKFYGVYTCVASNIHGRAEHNIQLQEAHPPSEILQAKMDVVTATTITFSFIGPSNPGGRPIKAFQVQYKEERQMWHDAKNKTWPSDSPYILENLEPQKTYVFRFAAINEVGISPWACNLEKTMPKKTYPAEPTILDESLKRNGYITSPYSNSYELRWSIPSHNGEPIDKYQIKYCAVRKENDEWAVMEDTCDTIEHRAVDLSTRKLINLRPDTYYSIEIRAHNVIGYSYPGEAKMKTARGSDIFLPADSSNLSSAVIIAIVLAALFIILIIVDVSCYFVNSTGLLWLMCGKGKTRSPREDDTKLGSEGKELLNNGHREGRIQIESHRPMLDNSMKKDTTVEFDMKKSISKTSFVGKDSAV